MKKSTTDKTIARAIKSGHIPKLRKWRDLENAKLTQGEKVCRFIETHVVVPEGELVGQNISLLPFQEAFIQAIFDGDVRARKAILSVGRKAGKTTTISCLLIAFMFMKDLIAPMSRINSAALSRDQSALVFNYMSKSLQQSKSLAGLFRIVHSGKRIVALKTGIEFQALAADAGRAMGLSPAVLVGDEWGAVVGTTGGKYDFIQSLLTAQGAHKNPLAILISTQAPGDADYLSIEIDDSIRNPSRDVVCHLYTADPELALDDPKAWEQACPAIGSFRSTEDVRFQADKALRLPSDQASFENLILNRRVSLDSLWLAGQVWKDNAKPYDMQVFRDKGVSIGLDLSKINDLCCAVISAMDDDGEIHVKCHSFSPLNGIEDRSARDRVPYALWFKQGHIYAPPGKTLDYDMVASYLKRELEKEGIDVNAIYFDRYAADVFFAACDRVGFANYAIREEVGQGFISISPRITAMETALLQGRIRHGGDQPVLNLGASSAIVISDGVNRKLDKKMASNKIDGLVAMLMSVYPHIAQTNPVTDIDAWIV